MTQQESIIRLTNAAETFMCTVTAFDNIGPIRVMDSRGGYYNRCETPGCDHDQAPDGLAVWHDDEHTETLWVV